MKNLILIALLFSTIAPSAHALDGDRLGGGVVTGDGFPIRQIPSRPIPLPLQTELHAAIVQIGKELPTLGARMWETLLLFQSTAARRVSEHAAEDESRAYEFLEPGDEHYATYSKWTEELENGKEITRTRLYFWGKFFKLPVTTQDPEQNSQLKVLLHELAHVVVTGDDHARAEALTQPLYELAMGEWRDQNNVPGGDNGMGALSLSELRKVSKLLRIKPLSGSAAVEGGTGEFAWVLRFFTQIAWSMNACDDFKLSKEIRIAGDPYRFPMPPHWLVRRLGLPPEQTRREALDYFARSGILPTRNEFTQHRDTDPFFRKYRRYCWGTTWEGRAMIDPTPLRDDKVPGLPLLLHPQIMGRFLKNASGITPKIKIAGLSAVFENGSEILAQLLNDTFQFDPTLDTLDRYLPGFYRWRDLYLRSHSEEEAVSRWTIDLTTHYAYLPGEGSNTYQENTQSDEIRQFHLLDWVQTWLSSVTNPASKRIQFSNQGRMIRGVSISTAETEAIFIVNDLNEVKRSPYHRLTRIYDVPGGFGFGQLTTDHIFKDLYVNDFDFFKRIVGRGTVEIQGR